MLSKSITGIYIDKLSIVIKIQPHFSEIDTFERTHVSHDAAVNKMDKLFTLIAVINVKKKPEVFIFLLFNVLHLQNL